MAKGTWADGAGLAWSEPAGVHWIQDWTLAAPVTVAALPAATINWKNYTNTTPVANTVLYNANINLRWRVEPPPLGPLAVTAQATINWKHIVNTAALALSAEPLATINWRNITNTSALALTTTPDAVAIAVKTSVTAVRLDLLTVIDAFIKVGPWPDVDPILYIDILAEDRVINIPAEDRSIQVEAEGRTITIRM